MIILAIAMAAAGNYRDTYRSERKFGHKQIELFDRETGKWSLLNPEQGRLNYSSWSHVGSFGSQPGLAVI
jgi:hypothetical protein